MRQITILILGDHDSGFAPHGATRTVQDPVSHVRFGNLGKPARWCVSNELVESTYCQVKHMRPLTVQTNSPHSSGPMDND